MASIAKLKPLLNSDASYWTDQHYIPNILYPKRSGIVIDLVNQGNITMVAEHIDKIQEYTDTEWVHMKELAAERISLYLGWNIYG